MSCTILNREFQHPSDGWYHIEPRGQHPNREAQTVQVIDETAIETIVNRFNTEASAHGFAGMLIDYEHFKHDPAKETRAAGWVDELQARNDGIYAKIRWTNSGRTDVDGGDYRFFSTEYDSTDCEAVSGVAMRPMRLAGLTLTNMPNNKPQRPITNSSRERQNAAGQTQFNAMEQFKLIVNRYCRQLNFSYDQAWNRARETEPALYAALQSGGASSANKTRQTGTLTNRQTRRAADCISDLAQARSTNRRMGFVAAWESVMREFPDLAANANGRVFNRADSSNPVASDEWRKAEKRAGAVLAALQADENTTIDRGLVPGINQFCHLRGVFRSAWKALQADEGMTAQQAFDHLKATEPVFWARLVLGWEDDTNETI